MSYSELCLGPAQEKREIFVDCCDICNFVYTLVVWAECVALVYGKALSVMSQCVQCTVSAGCPRPVNDD